MSRQEQSFDAVMPRCSALADAKQGRSSALLIATIASLFGAALLWAGLAEVEEIVSANGQVEPASHIKMINHPRGGRIVSIDVLDGQKVEAGDLLLRLDPTLDRQSLAEMEGSLHTIEARIARLEAELAENEAAFPDHIHARRPELVAEEEALLEARRRAHARELSQLEATQSQRHMELAEQEQQIARLTSTLSLLKKEAAAVGTLADKGLYPEMRRLAVERQLADATGGLAVAQIAAKASSAARDEAEAAEARLIADRESALRGELSAARAKAYALTQAVERQRSIVAELDVRAPVDGFVKDLRVTAAGQSFAAFAPLLTLVPTEGPLIVAAKIAQDDIGNVHVGQDATVKVMALDYLRYGTIPGKVQRIAADTTEEPDTASVHYLAVIALDRTSLESERGERPLVPGMLVDAELIVGERSILSFLTDRILRAGHGAFREG